MQKAIEERTPFEGVGTRLERNPAGFSYSAGKAGRINLDLAFQLSPAPEIEEGAPEITIRPGVVSGLWPASKTPTIDGTPLDNDPAPSLTTVAGARVFVKIGITPGVIERESGEDLWYEASSGGATVADPVIATDSDPDYPGAQAAVGTFSGAVTPGSYFLQIGLVTAAGNTQNVAYGHITASMEEVSTYSGTLDRDVVTGIRLNTTTGTITIN